MGKTKIERVGVAKGGTGQDCHGCKGKAIFISEKNHYAYHQIIVRIYFGTY